MFRPTVQTIRSQHNLRARILSPAIVSEEFFSAIIQTCNNCIDKYTMRVVKVCIYIMQKFHIIQNHIKHTNPHIKTRISGTFTEVKKITM